MIKVAFYDNETLREVTFSEDTAVFRHDSYFGVEVLSTGEIFALVWDYNNDSTINIYDFCEVGADNGTNKPIFNFIHTL